MTSFAHTLPRIIHFSRDSNRETCCRNAGVTHGVQQGKESWGSRPLPFSAKDRKRPFFIDLSIKDGPWGLFNNYVKPSGAFSYEKTI